MKAKNGSLSAEQKKITYDLSVLGYCVKMAKSSKEAIDILENYLIGKM